MQLGEMDLYLFGEGRHHRLWDMLGARVVDGGVQFAVWAPNARQVSVVGDWNGWQVDVDPLQAQGVSGIWAGVVRGASPGACYKLALRDASGAVALRADPMARRCEAPPAQASIVVGPSAHTWGDTEWMTGRAARQGLGRDIDQVGSRSADERQHRRREHDRSGRIHRSLSRLPRLGA